MNHCSHESKQIRVSGAIAAGISNQETAAIDTLGYQGVELTVFIGTIAATGVVKVQLEHSPDKVTWTTIDEAVDYAAADDDKFAVLDAFPAPSRYVRAKITRTIANSAVELVTANLYRALNQPPARDGDEQGIVRFVGADALDG